MLKERRKENQQLDLKLKQSPLNTFSKYKERFDLFRAKWDIRRYSKSTWVWFTVILSISLVITQIYTVQENISSLPKQIPLFKIYVDAKKTLVATNYIYIIPAISTLLIILGVFFSNKYYNKQRNLSNTLLWVMFLGNLTVTVALIRLINLY